MVCGAPRASIYQPKVLCRYRAPCSIGRCHSDDVNSDKLDRLLDCDVRPRVFVAVTVWVFAELAGVGEPETSPLAASSFYRSARASVMLVRAALGRQCTVDW